MKGIVVIVLVGVALILVTAPWARAPEPQHGTVAVSSSAATSHTAAHAGMTQQMRAGGPVAPMRSDPMWGMMRDPAHIRAEETYQRDLDRMLGRGG